MAAESQKKSPRVARTRDEIRRDRVVERQGKFFADTIIHPNSGEAATVFHHALAYAGKVIMAGSPFWTKRQEEQERVLSAYFEAGHAPRGREFPVSAEAGITVTNINKLIKNAGPHIQEFLTATQRLASSVGVVAAANTIARYAPQDNNLADFMSALNGNKTTNTEVRRAVQNVRDSLKSKQLAAKSVRNARTAASKQR